MGDKDHLTIVKQGKTAIARWRRRHRGLSFDLSDADLDGCALDGADLRGAELTHAAFARPYGTPRKRDYAPATMKRAILTDVRLRGARLCGVELTRGQLQRADLEGADLRHADLSGANLTLAILERADLAGANLAGADLTGANLVGANLLGADLSKATLDEAILREANLSRANLTRATLRAANLMGSSLVRANLTGATLTGSRVYGVSAWDVDLTDANVHNLIVTREDQAPVTVDGLEVAQFIYLMLANDKIKTIIDTVTSKTVLILGRFTPTRKPVLDAMRNRLREHDLVPVVFDFDVPADRNLTETITLLARMARFIVADLTLPKSIPQELVAIIPHLDHVPVQPLILSSEFAYSMFEDFLTRSSVLQLYRYRDQRDLLAHLEERVIVPAERRRQLLAKVREQRRSLAAIVEKQERKLKAQDAELRHLRAKRRRGR